MGKAWNKGIHTGFVPKTAFKSGFTPWNKGKKLSEEHKLKLSLSHKGKITWMKGKKRWWQSHKFKKGEVPWNKGLHKYLGGKRFEKGIIPWNKGLHISSNDRLMHLTKEEVRKGRIARAKKFASKEPTSIEKAVYEELKKQGLLFEIQKCINGKFTVDAYIPSLNLIIEADGEYWHSLEKVKDKDKRANIYFEENGYSVLRLEEQEIKNGNFINKINQYVN